MKYLKDFFEFCLFWFTINIFKLLPYQITLSVLKFLFYFLGYIIGIRKSTVVRQLKLCFPHKNTKEIKMLTQNIYSELAVTVAEVFIFDEKYFRDKIELVNIEYVHSALALGRGVIVASAHFCNWEIGARLLAKEFLKISGVVKNQRNNLFNSFLKNKRESFGIATIEMKNALKAILSELQKNKVVAILVDQYAQKQGTEIEFLGHTTKSYTSVAQLAIKFKTPIIMAFDLRDKNGKHNIIFHEPLIYEHSLYNKENILNITKQINKYIEEYITSYPQCWFWVHKKWRTQEQ